MLKYTATDQRGSQVIGTIDDETRTRRDVALELYELGYHHAAIHDDHALVAGIDTDPDGHRYWWASLKPDAVRAMAGFVG
ncbi:MAG TPA: hypothetical protein VFQ37_17475 [Mycobacterium sp.]|nr:hypothetical protein [Mycobacterium sp.]